MPSDTVSSSSRASTSITKSDRSGRSCLVRFLSVLVDGSNVHVIRVSEVFQEYDDLLKCEIGLPACHVFQMLDQSSQVSVNPSRFLRRDAGKCERHSSGRLPPQLSFHPPPLTGSSLVSTLPSKELTCSDYDRALSQLAS